MASEVIALEIGTSKVCALVGEGQEDDQAVVTGKGQCISCGMRKGVVTDLAVAADCVKTVLHQAEESADCTAREVYLVLSGGHIQGTINRGNTPVLDPERIVSDEDTENVANLARAISLPHERKVLHYCDQKYYIDDHAVVSKPNGMRGARLSLDMLIIHGVSDLMENAVNTVRSVGVEVKNAAFSGLCSAMATLTDEQMQCGALLIDLGGGTTSYMAYSDGIPAAAGGIGVGGDHVTNDILLAFKISTRRAEMLKYEYGSATPAPSDNNQRIAIPDELGFTGGAITLWDLNTVINARMTELFELILDQLKQQGLRHSMGFGVVLTGGGAHLKGVAALAEKIFDLPCVIGKPRNIGGVASMYEGPEYAAAAGMLRIAAGEKKKQKRPVYFGGLMHKVSRAFGNLP